MSQRGMWVGSWVCAWVLLTACGPQIQVSTAADPAQDFSVIHAYAWAVQPAPGDTTLRTEGLRARVESAVDAVLQAKGLVKVAGPEAAEVLVYWYASVRETAELRKLDYTESAPIIARTIDVFEQGTLVIDLVAPAEDRLLWRGTARARLDATASEAQRDARVLQAVANMFEQYPQR